RRGRLRQRLHGKALLPLIPPCIALYVIQNAESVAVRRFFRFSNGSYSDLCRIMWLPLIEPAGLLHLVWARKALVILAGEGRERARDTIAVSGGGSADGPPRGMDVEEHSAWV